MRSGRRLLFTFLLTTGLLAPAHAQDDVMLQGFYWDVPVDAASENGSWWDTLAAQAGVLGVAGFTGIWTPSPAKGNFGIYDMGYGIFDHYDLGNYDQKGTVETRFGSRAELLAMVDSMHTHGIDVYADIVLNHLYTSSSEDESNPAVKQYVFDEAKRDLGGDGTAEQYSPYPTNEIRWLVSNAQPGDYYVKIKGYHLNCSAASTERGYDLVVNWDGAADQPNTPASANWESEPNGGGGQYNAYPGSGKHVWAHVDTCGDVDEYRVTVASAHDLELRLEARRETGSGASWAFSWADQTNGYFPFEIWYNGTNLAATTLQARTNTGVDYVTHTGTGEANYAWDYTHFHPVDGQDYLGYPGSDEIIPNTKFFGNDFNTYNATVQDRLEDWGVWLTNTVGYDGYRLDFVRGFQEGFVADWIQAMPLEGGNQRFVVGEYWGSASRIKSWVNTLAGLGADADAFDFPLKSSLTGMANGSGSSWDMRWLNHAGMVRDDGGNSLPGTSVVTFVENHDTGKEHDKWVTKDWDMAYAYLLFAEGRPTVFYPHFYGVEQVDAHDASHTVQAPTSLRDDVETMMFARRTYLDGGMIVLSDIGNPYPSGDAYNVYVARRQGNGAKTGAILVLNNHDTQTKGLWVDNAPAGGYTNWANAQLVDAANAAQDTTQVYNDGRVYVWAPPRGYALWVPASEYVAAAQAPPPPPGAAPQSAPVLPGSFHVAPNYPNPFNPSTTLPFVLPEDGRVSVRIHNVLGQEVAVLLDAERPAGRHTIRWEADAGLPSGLYYATVAWDGRTLTHRMLLVK